MKNVVQMATLCAVVAMSLPGNAMAFTSREGIRVNPVGAEVFEVIPRAGGLGRHFWCAAGDYAQRALKVGWHAQIYIVRGRGPSETSNRRSAVQFTLQGALVGAPPKGAYGSENSLAVGDNMTVAKAFGYCHELQIGF